MVITWLTGRPCSGKTTIGVKLRDMLTSDGLKAELLDGDITRRNLWPELGFTQEDRDESVRRYGYLAEILARHNVFPIVSAVSPFRAARDRVRGQFPNQFLEVYVNAPAELCEERDIKGMYKKAREGRIPDFTGVTHPYEFPRIPEVECNTAIETVEESALKVRHAVYLAMDRLMETAKNY